MFSLLMLTQSSAFCIAALFNETMQQLETMLPVDTNIKVTEKVFLNVNK
jgi:hypothetical protein